MTVVLAIRRRGAAALTCLAVACSGLLAGAGPAAARPSVRSVSSGVGGLLAGIAATSARNAWAVGSTRDGKPLILRWNGKSWTRASSPALAGSGSLSAVAATSARDAWAVGGTSSGKPLILRWNGRAWRRLAPPRAADHASLRGVGATSAVNVWAVGSTSAGRPVIVHWNGRIWRRVTARVPTTTMLYGVTAVTTRRAWVAGGYGPGYCGTSRTLVLRWNGTTWTRTWTPSPAAGGGISAVAPVSPRRAWAAGGCQSTLMLRWNGRAWTKVKCPSPKGSGPDHGSQLSGIAMVSARLGWAAGTVGNSPIQPLIVRWNGTSWQRVPVSGRGVLLGIAATSAASAWAVGGTLAGKTLILHWNGRTWS